MRKLLISLTLAALAATGLVVTSTVAMPTSAAAASQTPFETFKEICELAGGKAKRKWGSGLLVCTFPDGGIVWCTPVMTRCGHRKARLDPPTPIPSGSQRPAYPPAESTDTSQPETPTNPDEAKSHRSAPNASDVELK